jgi:hypothetical protein
MKSNVVVAMKAAFHLNPLTQLWWTLKVSCILRHSLLNFFKLIEIATIQMLWLVKVEHTFSTFSLMKLKLKSCLNEHLHIVVGMYS